MITFKQYLNESINDKGILKALFIVGGPASGKSFTSDQLRGTVSPRIINTDIGFAHVTKLKGIEANSDNWKRPDVGPRVKTITKNMLAQYINSMVPLFIDGTSNDTSRIIQRKKILESVGYECGLVFVSASASVAKDRALTRAQKEKRKVDDDFIDTVYGTADVNKQELETAFSGSFYKMIKNNEPGEMNDSVITEIFRKTRGFYNAPLKNEIGVETLKKLREAKEAYLVPTIISKEELQSRVQNWYK